MLSAKSITMAELYGELNLVTNEWKDGLVAILARKILDIEGRKIFLVFDSHVDPVWIENLNTVLDDSKMFCLTNGERIRLNDDTNVMFETRDLNQASPATVSRCGMVYFSNTFLGSANVFRSLTLDSREFVHQVMRLISIEEMQLDYDEVLARAADLASSEMFKDEQNDDDEANVAILGQRKKDQFEAALVRDYPTYLSHFEIYLRVLYNCAINLCRKLCQQFDAVFDQLNKFIRQNCAEEAPTLEFQQIHAIVKYMLAVIRDRVVHSNYKLYCDVQKTKKTDKAEDGDTPVQQFNRALPTVAELQEKNQTGMAPIASILMDQRFVFALAWGLGGSLRS